MNSKVTKVRPIGISTLYVKFNTGESGFFDVSPYWNSSFFKELQDINYFRRVKVWNGTIQSRTRLCTRNDLLRIQKKDAF